MARKKMDITNFCRIMDMFGEKAAKDTFKDVADGKIKESTLEKYLYKDESKEDYDAKLMDRFKDL